VAGEAAGISMGLIMAGTATDKATEMLAYAHDTQHEKIIRGIVLGLALVSRRISLSCSVLAACALRFMRACVFVCLLFALTLSCVLAACALRFMCACVFVCLLFALTLSCVLAACALRFMRACVFVYSLFVVLCSDSGVLLHATT
jgi:hypothetical protein